MNERRDSLRTIVTVEYVDSHGNRYDEGFPINAADYINAVREKSDSELLEKEVRKVGKELNRSGDAIARAISAKCEKLRNQFSYGIFVCDKIGRCPVRKGCLSSRKAAFAL